MNNSKAFDDVIDYLEEVIPNGTEVDSNEISRLALCPAPLFQRIFLFISGVSIAEYVRKRRLTVAAQELMTSNQMTVLDLAIKYGFQSHSAFTRAFKEFHGITPSQAMHSPELLQYYLPIHFSNMRLVGGKRIMAEMKQIIYKEVEERIMVGMKRDTSFQDCGKVWQEYFKSKEFDQVCKLPDEIRQCDDIDENEGIGCMFNFLDEMHFTVILGDFVNVNATIPEGLATKYMPKGTIAQIQIAGNDVAEILDSAYFLITEAVEKTGRQIDFDQFYWCDVYTCERFCEPMRKGEKVIIDYIVPIK